MPQELANTLVTDDSSDLLLTIFKTKELAKQQNRAIGFKKATRQINRPVEISKRLV